MSLDVRGLQKSYSGFQVLRNVDLQVGPGTVHALLGANGAGKSTVIKCLGGVTAPDGGEIELSGEILQGLTPHEAFGRGIATIHQHLTMVESLSVTDNIFLGSERTRLGFRARAEQRAETTQLLERFKINVRPNTRVGQLPIGTRQLLEIAKAWHRTKVQVLILDEPTASLSGPETERLFAEIEQLKKRGVCVVYTTHRLAEVFRIADTVSVLRDGEVVVHGRTQDLKTADIVAGISRGSSDAQTKRSPELGTVLFRTQELQGPRFGPVSFDLRAGEVLGVYGALGSGRTSILETIAGAFRPTGGETSLDGRALDLRSPRDAIAAGIALVPADRQKQALLGSRSASENVLISSYGRLARVGARRLKKERAAFRTTAQEMELSPADPNRPAASFSGGNQQKLVVGRWVVMTDRLKLLVLDEPTQGVDVGARAQIYSVLRTLAADQQCAVLFSSVEALEMVALADRALVVDGGLVVNELVGSEITEDALIRSAHQFVAKES